jgi:hypothetical protein
MSEDQEQANAHEAPASEQHTLLDCILIEKTDRRALEALAQSVVWIDLHDHSA